MIGLLLFFVVGTSVLFGQTLTKMPQAGETYIFHWAIVNDYASYSVGTNGTGQTWDFRGLGISPSEENKITYISPFATPHFMEFPQAGLASMDNWEEVYSYYGLQNGSKFMLYGKMDSLGDVKLVYTDPAQLFVYPCSYGTSFFDNFQGTVIDWGDIITFSGNITFSANASGTLITDFGTFNNVLRVFVKTSYMVDFGDGGIDTFAVHNYGFYSPSYAHPLIQMEYWEEAGEFQDTFIIVYNPFYTSLTQAQLEEIKVFPTFVSQNLHLTIPERKQAEILIFNINGQEVFKASLKNSRNTFDLSDLPAGMYFVEVRLEEHRKFFKIIKQ